MLNEPRLPLMVMMLSSAGELPPKVMSPVPLMVEPLPTASPVVLPVLSMETVSSSRVTVEKLMSESLGMETLAERVTPVSTPPDPLAVIPWAPLPGTTVAEERVPPEMVKVLFTWTSPETVRLPPERTSGSSEVMLAQESVPVEWVTVYEPATVMDTSSVARGTWPRDQLLAVSQSPLTAVFQELVVRRRRGSIFSAVAKTTRVRLRRGMRSYFLVGQQDTLTGRGAGYNGKKTRAAYFPASSNAS